MGGRMAKIYRLHNGTQHFIYLYSTVISLLCTSQAFRTENDGEIFEVIVNKPAKLACEFSTNDLDKTWVRWWYIDGDKLVADNVDVQLKGYRISTNGSIGILDIDSATENFAGKYRCYIIHRNFDQIGVVTLKLLRPGSTSTVSSYAETTGIPLDGEVQNKTIRPNIMLLQQSSDAGIHEASTDLTRIGVLKSWIVSNLTIVITSAIIIILLLICLTCCILLIRARKVYTPDDNEYTELKTSNRFLVDQEIY